MADSANCLLFGFFYHHVLRWSTLLLRDQAHLQTIQQIKDYGFFYGPVCLTNTHSIGAVHEGAARWMRSNGVHDENSSHDWVLPVVGETFDGFLNDIDGFHVRPDHVADAIADSHGGPIAEGNVGGGTGMTCYEFKAGTGTASRVFEIAGETFTLGVLVQSNFGLRPQLTIAGRSMDGLFDDVPTVYSQEEYVRRGLAPRTGSLIAVIATDVPLLPIHIERLARRLPIGMARTGTPASGTSFDFAIAFSTANKDPEADKSGFGNLKYTAPNRLDPVFEAAGNAIEEAIINSLIAAETMSGRDGNTAHAISAERLKDIFR